MHSFKNNFLSGIYHERLYKNCHEKYRDSQFKLIKLKILIHTQTILSALFWKKYCFIPKTNTNADIFLLSSHILLL